jgi:hypothetical protein
MNLFLLDFFYEVVVLMFKEFFQIFKNFVTLKTGNPTMFFEKLFIVIFGGVVQSDFFLFIIGQKSSTIYLDLTLVA